MKDSESELEITLAKFSDFLFASKGLGETTVNNQDRAESIDEYAADWERLIQRHGAKAMQDAVNALRIDPDREDFYPTPGEVAQEIKRQALKKVPSHVYARG